MTAGVQLALRIYLATLVEQWERQAAGCDVDFHYRGPGDFLLAHGRFYSTPPCAPPPGYQPGAPNACFANAQIAAARVPRLRYCEGYAASPVHFYHHAWLLDERDQVVDLTWRFPATHAHHFAYFGVEFPVDYAWYSLWDCDGAVLDQAAHRWPLFTRPYDPDDLPVKAGWEVTPCPDLQRSA